MGWPVRHMGWIGCALLGALFAVPAVAEAPLVSIRPELRLIVPPGRPIARPLAAAPEASAEPVKSGDAPEPPVFDPAAIAGRIAAAPADAEPEGQAIAAEASPAEETVPEAAAPVAPWEPAAPARPDLRLRARPDIRLAGGPAPGRPVARPPLPPRPFYFDEVWTPRIYGAATLSPRPDISELAVAEAVRPPERPAGITRAAEAARVARQRGAVCGDPDIQGDTLGSVPGPGSCGIDGAVRVRSVAGIPLSRAARMDCTTARALLRWVENGAIPAVGSVGGGLREIRVIGEYSCRTRNNQPGARLSEHSFGRAIDISGFTLANGSRVSLLQHWRSGTYGRMLLDMHRSACGIFGTVLGPNANAAHRDHFHFDTARYRSGSYCR